MRNPYDVLRSKEQELVRVKKGDWKLCALQRDCSVSKNRLRAISLAKGDARQVVEMP